MKTYGKLLEIGLGAVLVFTGSWKAYPQSLASQPTSIILAGTNQPLGNASSPSARLPAGQITTLDGKTYRGVNVEKADPDGLVIRYSQDGGGIGIAKIKFKSLPTGLQQQYNYDPQKAAVYEAGQARAIAAWRAQSLKQDQTNRLAAIRQAEKDAEEQQQKEIEEQQKKNAPPEMTEEQKKQAQKEIENTWSGFKRSVQAGRITN